MSVNPELSRRSTDPGSVQKYELHSEEYLQKLMSTQFGLSMKLFSVFIVILLGTPLMNYFASDLMNTRMFGFTFSWLFLGVLFYPITWVIAYMYVTKSCDLEDEAATWVDLKASEDK